MAMTKYSFYLCKSDGSSTSLEDHDLAKDADVAEWAAKVLARHPKSAYVAAWDGERPILALERSPTRRVA
jgi:hypothetical protein